MDTVRVGMRRFAGEAVMIMRALNTHGQEKSERAEPTEQAAYGEQTASNEAETMTVREE